MNFANIHSVDKVSFKKISNIFCSDFLGLRTECDNMFIQKIRTRKPVSFQYINEDQLLTRINSSFMLFTLRDMNKDVKADLSKDVISEETVRDLTDFFYKQYRQKSSARFLPLLLTAHSSKCKSQYICYVFQSHVCRDTSSKGLRRGGDTTTGIRDLEEPKWIVCCGNHSFFEVSQR